MSVFLYLILDLNTFATATEELLDIQGSYWNVNELFNLQRLLKDLYKPHLQFTQPVVSLLRKYNETCVIAANVTSEQRQHPFIVIESVYDLGRKVVAQIVAKSIGGYYSYNPPKLFAGLSRQFEGLAMRAKFYALCKYAGANLVKHACQTDPVVMERYYHDQAVYSLAKVCVNAELPTIESRLYDWPADLLQPDLAFFLNYAETRRPSTNVRIERMVEIFRRMRNPRVIEIQASHSVQVMAYEIIREINSKLGKNYPLPRARFPTHGYRK